MISIAVHRFPQKWRDAPVAVLMFMPFVPSSKIKFLIDFLIVHLGEFVPVQVQVEK